VLDDVTPPFVKATAALNACDANLAMALHSLLDSKALARPGQFDLEPPGAFDRQRLSG
jgi:hypothetical protein